MCGGTKVNKSTVSLCKQLEYIILCGTPIDYNFKKIPRRQDFKGNLVENGAFYINKVKKS